MTSDEIRAAARSRLPALQAGETAVFHVPLDQPGRPVVYKTLQGSASHYLGPGHYRMSSGRDGSIAVTRVNATAGTRPAGPR